jgi:hypothetical protein
VKLEKSKCAKLRKLKITRKWQKKTNAELKTKTKGATQESQ